MESSKKFVQNKTIVLSFVTPIFNTTINIPFAVDCVKFRAISDDGSTDSYGVLSSDLINGETVGIVYRNDLKPISPNQNVEYQFQTPTKIQGNYTFTLKNLNNTIATIGDPESIVFLAEFIRYEF